MKKKGKGSYINKTNGTSSNLEIGINGRVTREILGIDVTISEIARQLIERQ